MLPKAQWGEYENAAPVDRLDLPGEVRRWAGVRTAAELVPVDAVVTTGTYAPPVVATYPIAEGGGYAWFDAGEAIGLPLACATNG